MVKFWNNKEPVNLVSIPRLKKLDTSGLCGWFDSSLMNLGASFDRWRLHSGDPQEVAENLDAINALWQELLSRDKP